MRTAALGCAFALAATAWTGSALAAGGHHAIDDAAILDRGQCEAEGWAMRARGGERLLHGGLNCGTGPVELGAAGEYARHAGESQTGWSLQAKVATPLTATFSVGAALQGNWQARPEPRHRASTLLLIGTWTVLEDVAVHVNVGRDFVRRDTDEARGGIGLEWSISGAFALIGERYVEQGTHFVRGGLRWLPAQRWQVDLSHARGLDKADPRIWTIGLTYAWD